MLLFGVVVWPSKPLDYKLLGENVLPRTLLSDSFKFIAIFPIAATIAAAGYIMKLGDLLGFN